MNFLAMLFVVAAVWALVSGRAHWLSGVVTRHERPIGYWLSVVTCVVIAALLWALGPVR